MPASPTVSIVDDDPWAREGIKDLVASLGYRTHTFASAEEFLKSQWVDATACVISDLQMPGLSGLDLQRRLASLSRTPSFILVTAFPDERCQANALGAGARGFLVKPFDEAQLISCLIEAIGPAF